MCNKTHNYSNKLKTLFTLFIMIGIFIIGGRSATAADSYSPPLKDGVYTIRPASNTSYCAGVWFDSTSDVANVGLALVDDDDLTRKFKFTYMGNGYYKIMNLGSETYLDVLLGTSLSGSNVQLFPYNGNASQLWKIKKHDNGYSLTPKCATKCSLNLALNVQLPGTNIDIMTTKDVERQRWVFKTASATSAQKKADPDSTIVKNIKVASPKAGNLKVSWSKHKKAKGYQVQIATNSSFTKNVKKYKTTNLSKTISDLKKGKKYYVRVRSYRVISDTTYYGVWSSSKTKTIRSVTVPTISIEKISSPKKQQIKLKLEKNSKISRYLVQTSSKKDFSTYAEYKVSKSDTSPIFTGKKSGKKCYVRVKGQIKKDGKWHSSEYWSSVKSITVK